MKKYPMLFKKTSTGAMQTWTVVLASRSRSSTKDSRTRTACRGFPWRFGSERTYES